MSLPIRPSNPLPRYHQIANVLRSRIDLLEWSPGEQLPSESALAASFGVSPLTVRQALALLAQEGRLVRLQGRGTFVSGDAAEIGRVRLTAPYHELSKQLRDLKLRLVDARRVRGPSAILALLGLPAGTEMLRIRRVRFRGERPMAYTISYVQPHLADAVTRSDLQQSSLIRAMESTASVSFTEADQIIEATLADDDAAEMLDVSVGSPLLLVQRNYRLSSGEIGLVVFNRYPSHLFRFEMQLVRRESGLRDWDVESDPSELIAATH